MLLVFSSYYFVFQSVDELTSHNERIWVPVPSPKPEEGLLIVNLGKYIIERILFWIFEITPDF